MIQKAFKKPVKEEKAADLQHRLNLNFPASIFNVKQILKIADLANQIWLAVQQKTDNFYTIFLPVLLTNMSSKL